MKTMILMALTALLFVVPSSSDAQPACVGCTCTPITDGWSCTWPDVDLSGLSDGPHTLTVRATNAQGVVAEHTITVYVVSGKPAPPSSFAVALARVESP